MYSVNTCASVLAATMLICGSQLVTPMLMIRVSCTALTEIDAPPGQ